MQSTQLSAPAQVSPIQFIGDEPEDVIEQQSRRLPTVQPAGAVAALAADPLVAMINAAVQRGAGIDELRELAQLARELREDRERERKRQAEIAFRNDFAGFKAENIVVNKTKMVEQKKRDGGAGPSYAQTEYHVVANLLQPALARHGFGYRFDVKFERAAEGGVAWCRVECKLEHRDGHVETVALEGPPDSSGAKNPLQEMQSSATFLMRHALLAITGTAQAGMDNDGRGAREPRGEDDDGDGESLVDAGRAAAMEGMAAWSKWFNGLTGKQKNAITLRESNQMRAAAREADEAAGVGRGR
jgi:hypothetical protein